MKQSILALTLSGLSLFSACTRDSPFDYDNSNKRIAFGVQQINSALENTDQSTKGIRISLLENKELESEAFSISLPETGHILVTGGDDAGLMYGGLELAEQINLYGLPGIKETEQTPYMKTRGVKFNIPLDVRTPTYSDPADASQMNIPEMWNLEFWKEYIDQLTLSRYNMISLWNLHPFPSMVRVPEYPDVALDDVHRSTSTFPKTFYEIGNGEKAPDILDSTEVVIKISMDKKIAFWKEVMSYAKDRNIDFYIMVWNIFDWGIEGKYGITEKPDNPVTRDYFRQSVKQMYLTYPDLAGIGLTVGENMAGFESAFKEEWAFESYGLGTLDAARANPERKFTFIHRMHQGQAEDILQQFSPLVENKNTNFIFSFKYAAAHVMSSIHQPYANRFVQEIKEHKTLWTLRNDDNYYFRWGAPGFVRDFMKDIPYEVSQGFYYGSDGYIWGREFLSREPENPRQLEVEKHWYHWMIWGRLGYNPELANERFMEILQKRFPEVNSKDLIIAWEEASMIYPLTTGFHWGAADFSWYIEGCKSHPNVSKVPLNFHNVNHFITQGTHPGTRNQTIPEYVTSYLADRAVDSITPLEVSEQLHQRADHALKRIANMDPEGNKELANTLNDIQSMAFLGKYYAFKINGATQLALYRRTRDANFQDEAVEELTNALGYWEKYTSNAMQQYKNPLWLKRVGHIDWVKLTREVERDIEIARKPF